MGGGQEALNLQGVGADDVGRQCTREEDRVQWIFSILPEVVC